MKDNKLLKKHNEIQDKLRYNKYLKTKIKSHKEKVNKM